MTDIDKLEAGPELDALVAEIMEPKPRGRPNEGLYYPVLSPGGWWVFNGIKWTPSKQPTTDWAAAGEVVEKLKYGGFCLAYCPDTNEWDCSFTNTPELECLCAYENTGPLAISRAALKAVEKGGG